MNEHTAFLRLAATAVDFPLEAADARALALHIDGCDTCRRAADAFRMDATALRSLPRRSPSPHVAAAIARAARGETRTGRPPLLMLSLGFLLVAGVAGAILGGGALRQLLIDRQPRPIVAPSAPPSNAIVLPVPSGPSSSADPRLGVEWQVVDSASDGPNGEARSAWAVTAGGPGFVAVGNLCSQPPSGELDCWGAPQVSSDGSSWEGVPRQPGLETGTFIATSGPSTGMLGVAAKPGDAIVAIGYAVRQGGGLGPAIWYSRDGRTWEREPNAAIFDGARFSDLVATGQGFVIVGVVYAPGAPKAGRPRGAIWTSPDGRAWQRVPDGPIFDVGGYFDTLEDAASGGPRRIVSAGGVTVSVGGVCNDKGLDCRPAFWSSRGGSPWDRVIVDEVDTSASDIVATPEGFLAVGSATTAGGCGGVGGVGCTAIVFKSSDGRSWQRHDVKVPRGMGIPDALTDAVTAGGRIIAISVELDGQPDGQTPAPSAEPVIDASGHLFWSSTDGLLWSPVQGIPGDFNPSGYQPMAAGAGRLVVVGDLNARIAVSPKG
jgi:hypothetical protein